MKVLFFLLMITACPIPSLAGDFREYRSPEVVVRFDPQLENAAGKIVAAYPEIRADLEEKLGWKVDFVPTVVLIHRNSEFQKRIGNDLVTAFAVSREKLIVMDHSKMYITPVNFQATFVHELSHLLLGRNIQAPYLPKWLNEGVAQWASGGISEIISPESADMLKQAALTDRLIPLKDLSSTFPRQPGRFILAYQESKSFVEFIVHEYGEDGLLSVLESLRKKHTVEQAVYENLSVSLNTLEADWRESLAGGYPLCTYILGHFSWLLFFMAALLTILGYLKFRIRMRNYRDEEDEDIYCEDNED